MAIAASDGGAMLRARDREVSAEAMRVAPQAAPLAEPEYRVSSRTCAMAVTENQNRRSRAIRASRERTGGRSVRTRVRCAR